MKIPKKPITLLLVLLLSVASLVCFAGTNTVKVLWQAGELKSDVAPQIIEGRTMVPMRALFEALGYTVDWNEATKTAVCTKAPTILKVQLDSKAIHVTLGPKSVVAGPESTVTTDVTPMMVAGRVLVPLKIISEITGEPVEWHGDTRTVCMGTEAINTYAKASPQGSIKMGETKLYEEILPSREDLSFRSKALGYAYETIAFVSEEPYDMVRKPGRDGESQWIVAKGEQGTMLYIANNKIIGRSNGSWLMSAGKTHFPVEDKLEEAEYLAFARCGQVDMKMVSNIFHKNVYSEKVNAARIKAQEIVGHEMVISAGETKAYEELFPYKPDQVYQDKSYGYGYKTVTLIPGDPYGLKIVKGKAGETPWIVGKGDLWTILYIADSKIIGSVPGHWRPESGTTHFPQLPKLADAEYLAFVRSKETDMKMIINPFRKK